jgi:hypothetical protein
MRSEFTQLLIDKANLNIAVESPDLKNITYFLSKLEHYPQIKDSESARKIYPLVESAKKVEPSFLERVRSKKPKELERLIGEIRRYSFDVSTEVTHILDTLSPGEEERIALIGTIKKLAASNRDLAENIRRVGEREYLWQTHTALWDNAYSEHYKALATIFKEMLLFAPWIRGDSKEIETYLNMIPNVHSEAMALSNGGPMAVKYAAACIVATDETIKLSLGINSLAVKVKVAYRITEKDLEEPKAEKTAEIIQRIEQPKVEKPPLIQIPKHQLLLEELEYLAEKELPAKLGLDRPVSDIQDVMNDIKRNLTSFLFGRIAELKLDDLPLRDDNMLDHTKKINESLSGRSKADKLTPQESKILGEYSLELKSYIRERKKDVQEELAH